METRGFNTKLKTIKEIDTIISNHAFFFTFVKNTMFTKSIKYSNCA